MMRLRRRPGREAALAEDEDDGEDEDEGEDERGAADRGAEARGSAHAASFQLAQGL